MRAEREEREMERREDSRQEGEKGERETERQRQRDRETRPREAEQGACPATWLWASGPPGSVLSCDLGAGPGAA